MLVYEKKVDGVRHLYGKVEGTIPAASDTQLTYKDAEGQELELVEKDTYKDDGKGGIYRVSDNKAVNVFIGDTQIIGEEIEVEPTMTGIEVTTLPTKTSYTDGESLDLTGMVVTGTLSNGETITVTEDCTTTPVDGAILTTDPSGEIEVVVSYFELTDRFTITVATGAPELDPDQEPGE